jgi:hypothetical protein
VSSANAAAPVEASISGAEVPAISDVAIPIMTTAIPKIFIIWPPYKFEFDSLKHRIGRRNYLSTRPTSERNCDLKRHGPLNGSEETQKYFRTFTFVLKIILVLER